MTTPTINCEYTQLGPLKVPRIFNGLWQLSSDAWGVTDVARTLGDMARYANKGLYAFDMADQYGPAESIFGDFRTSFSHSQVPVAATKWCVFANITPTRETVETAVRARLTALQATKVDLLQIHWGDYTGDYIGACQELASLQNEGLITTLGLCNMDCQRTEEICTALGSGVIVSNQVQFSLIDQRPLAGMVDVCAKHGLKLLTYGTLCGGFLSDKYLGASEPDFKSASLTPSQRKYLDVITSVWGTWSLFQDLLRILRTIGDRHSGASIASIATRWVLDQPSVGAVLVGTRLGVTSHLDDAHTIFALRLQDKDYADIDAVLAHSKGQEMITRIGDCGAEYRRRIEGVKYYSPEGHA
ncbi:Aldo kereductase, partial [Rhizoctonia solani]